MTKKVDTWMPLLIDKYLGDTTDLTTEQHGAYMLLLMAMWKKDGALPNDDQRLASITRLPASRWKASKGVLMEFFRPTEDGSGITQKRLSVELQRSKAATDAKAEAGAKGAAKRWQKGLDSDGGSNGTANGTAIAAPPDSQWQTGASTSIHTPDTSYLSASTDVLAPHRPLADGPQLTLVEPPAQQPKGPPDCPHLAVLDLWASVLPTMPRHQPSQWKGTRADHLRARWREAAVAKGWKTQAEGMDWMRRLFEFIAKSAFLTGQVPAKESARGPFQVRLAWLVEPGNWAKVVEGEYHRTAA